MSFKMIFRNVVIFFVLFTFFSGCTSSQKNRGVNEEQRIFNRTPAVVEKAWLARNHYDSERRLLIPRYSGARWGSVLEYTEGERLEYKDWWVRDVKLEELNPSPSTEIKAFDKENEGQEILNDKPTNTDGMLPMFGNPTNIVEVGENGTDAVIQNENPVTEEFSFPSSPVNNSEESMTEDSESPFAPLPPGF